MINVSNNSDVILDINGYFVDQTNSNDDTSVGTLTRNTGAYETALGYAALHNPSGVYNTAVGVFALYNAGSGADNTAVGAGARLEIPALSAFRYKQAVEDGSKPLFDTSSFPPCCSMRFEQAQQIQILRSEMEKVRKFLSHN